jgi:hypothetical protein
LDRIDRITWIFFPFPEEKEKENPPAAEEVLSLTLFVGLIGDVVNL